MLSNNEIFDIYWKNRTIRTCLECQFAKVKGEIGNYEDMQQDLALIILQYDNEKLNKIHEEKHFNAFITGIITRNLFSRNSPYYSKYKKFASKTDELTPEDNNLESVDDFYTSRTRRIQESGSGLPTE